MSLLARITALKSRRSSLKLTAITSRWSRPTMDCTLPSTGSSRLHGPHQEAQKVTITTFPRYWLTVTGLPSRSLPSTSGGMSPGRGCGGRSPPAPAGDTGSTHSTAAMQAAIRLAFISRPPVGWGGNIRRGGGCQNREELADGSEEGRGGKGG